MLILCRVLTSRWMLSVFDALLLVVSCSMLFDFWTTFQVSGHDEKLIHEIEEILEGAAVLYITYGVALESRHQIMSVLHLYPRYHNAFEESLDTICGQYGLILLLWGLFMEVPVQLVKIPDRIINTAAIEKPVLLISVAFMAITSVTLLVHILRLLTAAPAVEVDHSPLETVNACP